MTLTILHDKVMGKMIDSFGVNKTKGGIFVNASEGTEEAIRPRWFKITHVGPEQTDINVGDFALVAHGRWSRGLDLDGTSRKEDFIYLLDNDEILGTSDTYDF